MKNELLAVKVLNEHKDKLRDQRDVLLSIQAESEEVNNVNKQISEITDSVEILESTFKLHAKAMGMIFSSMQHSNKI